MTNIKQDMINKLSEDELQDYKLERIQQLLRFYTGMNIGFITTISGIFSSNLLVTLLGVVVIVGFYILDSYEQVDNAEKIYNTLYGGE